MNTPEDLAKAREIWDKHKCKDLAIYQGYSQVDIVDSIAAAIAEARTTPKPDAEVVEALEALIKKIEAIHDNADYQSVWSVYAFHGGRYEGPTYVSELQQARAALAAQSAREKP